MNGTWSTVTAVMSARFLTRPQDSPSGVSDGHSTPHWLGCRLRGPLTCSMHAVPSRCLHLQSTVPEKQTLTSAQQLLAWLKSKVSHHCVTFRVFSN